MDDIDRAQEQEMNLREDALQAQQRRAGLTGVTAADSATHCAVCESLIPVARRRAVPGVQLCVVCQEAHEREASRG